jgi:ssDNA-binding Zn-finger/Zn-ribbon topoisomerase 1
VTATGQSISNCRKCGYEARVFDLANGRQFVSCQNIHCDTRGPQADKQAGAIALWNAEQLGVWRQA